LSSRLAVRREDRPGDLRAEQRDTGNGLEQPDRVDDERAEDRERAEQVQEDREPAADASGEADGREAEDQAEEPADAEQDERECRERARAATGLATDPDGERYPDQEHRLHAREVVPGGRSVTESEATPVDESAEHDEPDTDQHEQTDDFCAGRAVGLLARASGRDDRLRRRDGRRDRAARARRGLRRRGRGGLLSRRSGWWIRLLRHGVLAPCSAGDGAPDIYGQAT